MKPAPFDYHRVADLDELLHRLAQAGDDARILAGGQSLVPMLNFRIATPKSLLDISRLATLQYLRADADGLEIGAGTRYRMLEEWPELASMQPLLAWALPWIAHPAVRNRGTIGGSLALADPAAEMPACCLALGGALVVRSAGGERVIPAERFFRGLYETDLRPDEALVAVRLPRIGPQTRCGIYEVAQRHGDLALAGAALSATVADGSVSSLRVALFGIADRAVLSHTAARRLMDHPERTTIAELSADVSAEVEVVGDPGCPTEVRRHLAGVVIRRAFDRMMEGL